MIFCSTGTEHPLFHKIQVQLLLVIVTCASAYLNKPSEKKNTKPEANNFKHILQSPFMEY